MNFVGYIYKIIIPTSEGLRYYYGRRLSSTIDQHYWGSGLKLKKWVYKHTNGQIKNTCYLSDAIVKKLGLKREILYYAKTIEEAYQLEYEIVKAHKDDFDCWNILDGGLASNTYGHLGHPHSIKTKEYLRKINLHKDISIETRQKMSKSHLGKASPKGMLGKKHSKETITKIIETKRRLGKLKHSKETIEKIKKAKANISEITRQKMSSSQQKRKHLKHSKETKLKISKTHSGSLNPAFGKRWWTDGKINIFTIEKPGTNFRLGRLKFK